MRRNAEESGNFITHDTFRDPKGRFSGENISFGL